MEEAEEPNDNAYVWDAETVKGRVPLELKGRRLNATKEHRAGRLYAPDRRLQPRVAETKEPLLDIVVERGSGGRSGEDGWWECLGGELLCLTLRVTCLGQEPPAGLLLATDPGQAAVLVFGGGNEPAPVHSHAHGFHLGADDPVPSYQVHPLLQGPLEGTRQWQVSMRSLMP